MKSPAGLLRRISWGRQRTQRIDVDKNQIENYYGHNNFIYIKSQKEKQNAGTR
jgi:hypothetical protein